MRDYSRASVALLLVLLVAVVQRGTGAPPHDAPLRQRDGVIQRNVKTSYVVRDVPNGDDAASHDELDRSVVDVSSVPAGFTVAPSAECQSSEHVHPTQEGPSESHLMPSPTHLPHPDPSSDDPFPSTPGWDSQGFPSASHQPDPPASSAGPHSEIQSHAMPSASDRPEPSTADWNPSAAPQSHDHSDLMPSATNHPEPPASSAAPHPSIGPHSDFPSQVMPTASAHPHPEPSSAAWNPSVAPHSQDHSGLMPSATNHPEPPMSTAAHQPSVGPHSDLPSHVVPSASGHPGPAPSSAGPHPHSSEHVRPTPSQPPMPGPSASHHHHHHIQPTPSQHVAPQSAGTEQTPNHDKHKGKHTFGWDSNSLEMLGLGGFVLGISLVSIGFLLFFGRRRIGGTVRHVWDRATVKPSDPWSYEKLQKS